ncbi:glycosyltransferase [Polynucleobacter sp. MWH-UH25E]|uniref:glycosyltransferase n=1 Tax=Polynucleobacter sp. MWH-UH25E TaxID=1855616 RepID=UPI001BFED6A4|nr:glycosyltransferase [Polynucleobacter sp. MWH-UH25E]QWD62366.1 glycosyltransferase [Polynucleobacter sp. MWH-UH25E]
MILIVAPYSGTLPENSPFLAGAKKIRTIIKILKSFDDNVVLLNSGYSHDNNQLMQEIVDFDGVGAVKIITPSARNNSRLKLLVNLINSKKIIDDVVSIHGIPNVVWCYNGYAFEMRVAAYLRKKYRVKTILEFEDWHFARRRLFNPKPYLDWIFWRLAIRQLDYGIVVNGKLADKLANHNIKSVMLPGIVSPHVSVLPNKFPPFKNKNTIVGYFGGLSSEKGADKILRLVEDLDVNANFIVTGTGELQGVFKLLAKKMPDRLKYLGAVSEWDLIAAIAQVDVIINPHVANDGIFPFKIIEALGSGRLLISTKLPMHGYESYVEAIQFYDGSYSNLVFMINSAADIYKNKKNTINRVAEIAHDNFGQENLNNIIGNLLQVLNTHEL